VVCKIEGINTLDMETLPKKGVPSEFWRYGYQSSNNSSLGSFPFEALNILEKIPRKTLKK
jgi:hypothetical protein